MDSAVKSRVYVTKCIFDSECAISEGKGATPCSGIYPCFVAKNTSASDGKETWSVYSSTKLSEEAKMVHLTPEMFPTYDGSFNFQEIKESFSKRCDSMEENMELGKADKTQENKQTVSLKVFPDDKSGVIKKCLSQHLQIDFDESTSTNDTNILVLHDEKSFGYVLNHLKDNKSDINLHLKQCAEQSVLLILVYPENSGEDVSVPKLLLEDGNCIAGRYSLSLNNGEIGVQKNDRELKRLRKELQENIQFQKCLKNGDKVYLKIYPSMETNKTMETNLLKCLQSRCNFKRCSSESFTNILVLRIQGRYKDELEIMKTPIENCPKKSVLLILLHPEHRAGMPSKSDMPETAGAQLQDYILGIYHLFAKDNMVETRKNPHVFSDLCTAIANQVRGKSKKRGMKGANLRSCKVQIIDGEDNDTIFEGGIEEFLSEELQEGKSVLNSLLEIFPKPLRNPQVADPDNQKEPLIHRHPQGNTNRRYFDSGVCTIQ